MQQGKYTDLGIQDPTGGTITAEDADIMARTLIEDSQYENIFKNELANYYTSFVKQNWMAGKENRLQIQEGYMMTPGGRLIKDPNFDMFNEYNDPNYKPETIEEQIELIKADPNFTDEQKKERIDYLKEIIKNVE